MTEAGPPRGRSDSLQRMLELERQQMVRQEAIWLH